MLNFKCFRVDPDEVTFRVEKNSKGYSAIDVARRVGEFCLDTTKCTGCLTAKIRI